MSTTTAARSAPDALPDALGSPAVQRTAGFCLLTLLAIWARSFWLGADLHMDELYHLLAGQGWLATGEPRIADGVYERSWLFTGLVAQSMKVLGTEPAAVRLPSVLFGTALVLLVFTWLRRIAGPIAAWTGGLLLALSPLAVEVSQLTRFYALHALVFWLAAVALYRLVEGSDGRRARIGLGVATPLLLTLAWHLQLLTAIGSLGLGLWLAWMMTPRAIRWTRRGGSARYLVAGGLLLSAGLVGLVAIHAGLPQEAWAKLRYAPGWATSLQNQVHFYHIWLLTQFPLLWPATGFLAIAALAFRPRAAGFCIAVFGTTLVLESVAGHKAERYIYFVLPFLMALWGIGLQSIAGALASAIGREADAAAAGSLAFLPRGLARMSLLTGAVLFTFVASGGPAQLLFHLAKGKTPIDSGRLSAEWQALPAVAHPWLEGAEVVLASNELAALWWLGRTDYLVHGSRLSELAPGALEGIDPRTGLPVIATPESVADIIACYRSGLIVLDWRDHGPAGVSDAIRARIATLTALVPMPEFHDLLVHRWQHEGPVRPCAAGLPKRAGGVA